MKLMLTGAYNYTDKQIEYFEELGFQILYAPDEREPIDAGVDLSDVDAVICNGLFLYTPIERFDNLKFIQLTSAGLDRVPLDYIKEHGIRLHNARGVYSIPMAEFALCGVLQLIKQSKFFYHNQKMHKWEKHRGLKELSGKNVCVVGAGSIGNEIAKRFKAFDCRVTGVDLYPCENDSFDEICRIDMLDVILKKADIVVLSLPVADENKGFFNKEKFALMKNTAIFVNVARGGLVNQTDLINALSKRQIGGAVLDVFEEEPLDESSTLWDFENVIITPHNSFVSDKNNERLFSIITENLKGFFDE